MERSSNSLLNLQNTLPLFRCGREVPRCSGSSASALLAQGSPPAASHRTAGLVMLCFVNMLNLDCLLNKLLVLSLPALPCPPYPAVSMTRRRWLCWAQSLRSTSSAWLTHAHGELRHQLTMFCLRVQSTPWVGHRTSGGNLLAMGLGSWRAAWGNHICMYACHSNAERLRPQGTTTDSKPVVHLAACPHQS